MNGGFMFVKNVIPNVNALQLLPLTGFSAIPKKI